MYYSVISNSVAIALAEEFTIQLIRSGNFSWLLHLPGTAPVSVLKKKQNHDPSLQYRKAKEPTVKLNGLMKKVLTRRY